MKNAVRHNQPVNGSEPNNPIIALSFGASITRRAGDDNYGLAARVPYRINMNSWDTRADSHTKQRRDRRTKHR